MDEQWRHFCLLGMGQRQKSFRKEPARFGSPFIGPCLISDHSANPHLTSIPQRSLPKFIASSFPFSWNSVSHQCRGPAWKHQALVMRIVESNTPQRSLGLEREEELSTPTHTPVPWVPKSACWRNKLKRQTLTYGLKTLEIRVDEESRMCLCVAWDT